MAGQASGTAPGHEQDNAKGTGNRQQTGSISLFLAGDVMTGRGIDQILAHPSDPAIYEPYMRNAYGYVELAEYQNGPIPKPADNGYIWGDVLTVLDEVRPDARIINLETSVTASDDYWPGKGINYRMHPDNIGCLTVASLDCAILANNHVLDWGRAGLEETLAVLRQAGIKTAGAGRNIRETRSPAVLPIPGKGRVLVFAYGADSSGVPSTWTSTVSRPGVNVLPDLSGHTLVHIQKEIAAVKQPGDLVLFSIHWGGNWGYSISKQEKDFAHGLIDRASVDIVYGHSSHHPKGIEVYKDKLILYGCGDFLNDYEGISGYDQFRGDLTLMYLPGFDPSSGRLVRMRIMPMQIKRFQTIHAEPEDRQWLLNVLNREGKKLGTRLRMAEDGSFELDWEKE